MVQLSRSLRKEHFLLPTLKEGQIVVMDNLQVHKSTKVRKLIESVGANVLFLAPYSPEFSAIEEAFSKIKAILRTIELALRRLWWKQ
jgi:transposase